MTSVVSIYPAMLLFGIPALIVLRIRKLNKLVHYITAGALGGATYLLIFLTVIFLSNPPNASSLLSLNFLILFLFIIPLILGAFCGALNWAFLFLPIKKTPLKLTSSNF